jgi:ABC-2 type transport system permease protein
MLRHIRAVGRKEFHHIQRDRSTLILVLFTPALILLLMAYALTVDLKHVPLAVLDLDRSSVSQSFIQEITAGEDLDIVVQAAGMDEIDSLLMKGSVKAAIIIGPGFASDLQALKGIPLQIIIDGTEPESGNFAVEHITQRAEEFIDRSISQRLRAEGLPPESLQPFDLRLETRFNPDLKPRNALIPGLISMVLGFPALSVALTLAHEREHGTLEQLLATPIRRVELLLGKIVPYVLVGLINVIIIPLFAMAWFHIVFNGSFLVFFGLSALFMFAVLGMGTLVGVFMRTQAAALALSFLVIFFPGFFLTGIFFPLASMPEMARLESLALPGSHYAIITRGVFLQGVGLEVLWPYAVMLIILGVAFTLVAALFFRKKLG